MKNRKNRRNRKQSKMGKTSKNKVIDTKEVEKSSPINKKVIAYSLIGCGVVIIIAIIIKSAL